MAPQTQEPARGLWLTGVAVGAAGLAAVGSTVVASLALVHVVDGWAILLFYTLPALVFAAWGIQELAPPAWRRSLRALHRSTLGSPRRPRAPAVAVRPRPAHRPLLELGRLDELESDVIKPWLLVLRGFVRAWRRPRVRLAVSVAFGIATLAITAFVVRRYATSGWPLAQADARLVATATALLLTTFVLKAVAWQRVFRRQDRPPVLKLAVATGFASVAGVVLPGRFDDAVRLTIVQRLPGRRPAVATLALSLFLLGLLDTAALAPLAVTAAVDSRTTPAIRVGLGIVAGAGAGAAVLAAVLPRLAGTRRLRDRRLGDWLHAHAPAAALDVAGAAAIVLAAWLARAAAVTVLLEAVGLGVSFPLAIAYLCGGAALGALPVGPAGAATQAGVGAAILAAEGLPGPEAVAFAFAAQLLTVLAGAAVAALAAVIQLQRPLRTLRARRRV